MNSTKCTIFRLKQSEQEQLKKDAHAHEMTVSEYLRYLIKKERQNGKMSIPDVVYSEAVFGCKCDNCGGIFTCSIPTRLCKDCYEEEMSKLPKLSSFAIGIKKEYEKNG